MKRKSSDSITPEQIKTLIDTALGKVKADMVIVNADLVNVYSGELQRGYSVAVKGEKIAYVGENAGHTIGPETRVIDATGKTLIPGLIDAHMHLLHYYTVDEFLRYGIKGGTTAIITEAGTVSYTLGCRWVDQFLEAISDQPIKIFATVSPLTGLGPAAQGSALSPESLRRLLKQERVVGLGETFWSTVIQGDERIIELFAETMSLGKVLEGHSSAAKGNKLQAYIASGISSCHESITAEEVLERVRLGIHTMIREGDIRRDLEAIASIKDEKIDFRRLVLCTDGVSQNHLMEHGYMEFVVQKAIDLGFNPIVAIQMATLNPAEHFSLDNLIGGIAPNRYADMVLIPDLKTIKAEMVISNGRVIARDGELLVPPRKHDYHRSTMRSVHLPGKLKPDDFNIRVEGQDIPVIVRVINQATELVTREEQIAFTPKDGLLEADVEGDILKLAVIERTNDPGKMFTGFVKGLNIKKGAYASSHTWGLSGIVVVGTNDEDMAGAVNRVFELQGGAVAYAGGKILAELPMPVAGMSCDSPIEVLRSKFQEMLQKATELGTWLPNFEITFTALTSDSIPFIRICEAGYVDTRGERVVGLTVS